MLKTEHGEEHLALVAGIVPAVGHDKVAVLQHPDDLQTARRPARLLAQAGYAVRDGWIVLDETGYGDDLHQKLTHR